MVVVYVYFDEGDEAGAGVGGGEVFEDGGDDFAGPAPVGIDCGGLSVSMR